MTMQRDSYKSVANSHNTIMQRRHFELIADVISQMTSLYMNEPFTKAQQKDLACVFANKLSSTNPNFNRDKFLRACGVE